METEKKYKKELINHLECTFDQIYLYWKGRVALTAILKSMKIGENDEVIVQAFTCVVVVNAIIYQGAVPVFTDIDSNSLNSSVNQIKKSITAKTKAIILQNTFGLSTDVDKIVDIAKSKNIYVIEDCTHGFGGTYEGHKNGFFADASFYSSQWNKPFSTGLGGIAVVRNTQLQNRINEINKTLLHPTKKDIFSLQILIFIRHNFVNSFTFWKLVKIYRWLSKYNLILGSSSGEEINGIIEPIDYFKRKSEFQMKIGLKALSKFNNLTTLRKQNANTYHKFLLKKKKTLLQEGHEKNHSYLKFPLLVKERDNFLILAERNKIELGEWFNSPIHPVKENLEIWGVNLKEIPNSNSISKNIVNLPTDCENINKVLLFMEKYSDRII